MSIGDTTTIAGLMRSLRSRIRYRRTKSTFRRAKVLYKNALTVLEYSKSDDVEALRSGLRHYAVLCASSLRRERVISIITIPFIVLAYYGVIIAVALALGAQNSRSQYIPIFFVSIGASLLCVIFMLRMLKGFKSRLIGYLLLSLAIFGVTMAASHGPYQPLIYIPNANNASFHDIIIDCAVLFAASIATYGLVSIGGGSIFTLIITPARKRNADIVIINTLTGILQMLGKKKSNSANIGTKAEVCQALQFAADYLEEGVPRALDLPDPATRKILQAKLADSAGYLHEMQLRVALAKEEALNNICNEIAYFIELITRGEYDTLPVGVPTTASHDKSSGLIRFGRMLIVAVIPFACLIGVRYAGLELSPEFTGWAIVVALAWAAITLVSAIDPLYKTRLKDVQDLISTVRGKDGGLSDALSASRAAQRVPPTFPSVAAAVPCPCQNGRKTAVASGHSRTSRTASDLGMGWLTRCAKHTSKQRVMCISSLALGYRVEPYFDLG